MYGVRLRALFTGGLTWRELGVLVRALPPDSATRTAMNDGTPEPSGEQILLADLYDLLQRLDWHTVAAQATKKSELPKKPKPYPRYWDPGHGRKRQSPERVAKLDDARRRKAERQRAIAEGRIA